MAFVLLPRNRCAKAWGQASSMGLIRIITFPFWIWLDKFTPYTNKIYVSGSSHFEIRMKQARAWTIIYLRLRHMCDMLNIAILWDTLQSYPVVISSERTESAISLWNYIPSQALMRFTTWVSDQTSKSEANFFCHTRKTAQQRLSEASTFWRYLANSQGGQHRKTNDIMCCDSPTLPSPFHWVTFPDSCSKVTLWWIPHRHVDKPSSKLLKSHSNKSHGTSDFNGKRPNIFQNGLCVCFLQMREEEVSKLIVDLKSSSSAMEDWPSRNAEEGSFWFLVFWFMCAMSRTMWLKMDFLKALSSSQSWIWWIWGPICSDL